MFDIGLGEILILAVIGLLIFGPERLPRAAADAARTLRNVKAMAGNARKDLADSAGVDLSDAQNAFNELRDLHPRRLAKSFLEGDDEDDIESAPRRKKSDESATDSASTEAPSSRFDPDAT